MLSCATVRFALWHQHQGLREQHRAVGVLGKGSAPKRVGLSPELPELRESLGSSQMLGLDFGWHCVELGAQ